MLLIIKFFIMAVNCFWEKVCVNKFSVKPSSPYSYSEMESKIFYRCFDVDGVGVRRRQTRPGLPEGKSPPIPVLTCTSPFFRREGRPVRPWREAHSLSPCPDGQRLRLRTRKPDGLARVLHPWNDHCRCYPADSSWACPPSSRGIDVYFHRMPAGAELGTVLITSSVLQDRMAFRLRAGPDLLFQT